MLAEGTALRPYRILAPLGAGGLGEVYRACFEREPRTISQLNRPHIRTLHDIGHRTAPITS